MQNKPVLFQTRKTKHKTNHLVLVKRTDQYCAYFFHGKQGQRREYLTVFNSPDFLLQIFDCPHLRNPVDVANDYRCWFHWKWGGSVSQIRRPSISSLSQAISIGLVT